MESYYPIMLNLSGKKVIVVGGGKVAERKITGLIGSNANITVVSPEVSPEINRLVNAGKVVWLAKAFSSEDVAGAFMVFAATNIREVNQSIKTAAQDCPLVTIVDDPEGSNFQVPAKVQQGRLTIAVSTGGASPNLAREIRDQLGKEYGQYDEYLEFLFAARQQILRDVTDPSMKSKLLKAIAGRAFLNSDDREADFQAMLNSILDRQTFE